MTTSGSGPLGPHSAYLLWLFTLSSCLRQPTSSTWWTLSSILNVNCCLPLINSDNCCFLAGLTWSIPFKSAQIWKYVHREWLKWKMIGKCAVNVWKSVYLSAHLGSITKQVLDTCFVKCQGQLPELMVCLCFSFLPFFWFHNTVWAPYFHMSQNSTNGKTHSFVRIKHFWREEDEKKKPTVSVLCCDLLMRKNRRRKLPSVVTTVLWYEVNVSLWVT